MNRRERDEFKPQCERCGELITDIEWLDAGTPTNPDQWVFGYMLCSAPGCYGPAGSRVTSPIVPGELTIEDHAWVQAMNVSEP